jgi:hypothetical protein
MLAGNEQGFVSGGAFGRRPARYKSQIYVQKSIVIPKVQFMTSSRDQSPALLSADCFSVKPRLHKTPCWLPLYGFENRVFQNRLSFLGFRRNAAKPSTGRRRNQLQVLKMSPPKFLDGRKIPSAATFA